jgi:cell division protein FtsQ
VRRLGPRRVRLIAAASLALVLVAAGVLWLLYGSSWLRVERVTVSGTGLLTDDQVREAADVPVGSPLVSVDTGAVAARLREKLLRIDSADVTRSWPHDVRVEVTEREPVLLVRKAGKFVKVDDAGVRFDTVSRAPEGVPLLELRPTRSGSAAASLRRFGPARLVREAVRVAGDLPSAVARGTRRITVRSYDDITLELTGGRTVAWGSGEQGGAKARTLTALMKAAPGAAHFDVSAPAAPASSGS